MLKPPLLTRITTLLRSVANFALSSRRIRAEREPSRIHVAIEITPPPNCVGCKICAGLKRDGRTFACGKEVVPEHGNVTVNIHAIEAIQAPTNGECELWLTINRDALESCYPNYGDLFVHQNWMPQKASPTIKLADPSVWKERTLSARENLITVHYHRYDEDYDNVSVWTWDAHLMRTPVQNELFVVGHDDYGPILQFDRTDYGKKGDSNRIGLLVRLASNWNRKDGGDKFWNPNMGNEIYLIGGMSHVWTQRPDTSPRVVGAYIDAPNRIVLGMSRLLNQGDVTPDRITITDDQQGQQSPIAARLLFHEEKTTTTGAVLDIGTPLDITRHSYKVSVQGFGDSVRILPRTILADAKLFYDGTAVLGATYTTERTIFRVFAPTAYSVQVVIYDQTTGNQGCVSHVMRPVGREWSALRGLPSLRLGPVPTWRSWDS